LQDGGSGLISLHAIQANQAVSSVEPWSSNTPTADAAQCRALSLEALRVAGVALQPIVPEKAEELLNALGAPRGQRSWSYTRLGAGEIGVEGQVKGVKLFERK
jgi:methionyl-tRNA synthetase